MGQSCLEQAPYDKTTDGEGKNETPPPYMQAQTISLKEASCVETT